MQIARLALAQAENVARYSLVLLPAQRRALLGQIIEAYQALGDASAAAVIRERLDTYAAGPGITVSAGGQLLPILRGGVALPQPVEAVPTARQQAAAHSGSSLAYGAVCHPRVR